MITISVFADEISADLTEQMDTCQSHGIRCFDVRGIDGATPAGGKDLFATIRSERFLGIFDRSNCVEEGSAPYNEVWADGVAELTDYFHIKDKVAGRNVCVPAGEGAGEFDLIFADLKARGWSGYMTLEPHLQVVGQFAGFTGPELFAKAVAGLKAICDDAGLKYE